jgi:two-component system, cell cycle response regulator DivK
VKGKASPRAFILVVEDNPANQMLIQFTLESSGYHVEVAGAAREALAIIGHGMPDLVLMDIQVPGQDGLSLTRQLKADPAMKAIPVVALTARAMIGDRELCLDAGCCGYISKPIDTRTIVNEVANFLRTDK